LPHCWPFWRRSRRSPETWGGLGDKNSAGRTTRWGEI